jgi:hypothetical protein
VRAHGRGSEQAKTVEPHYTPRHNGKVGRYSRILAEDFCYAVLGRLLRRCEVVPINDPSHRLKKRLIALEGEAGVG